MQLLIGFSAILVIVVVEIPNKVVAGNLRGRKHFDPTEDGFFENFGLKKGQYNFGEKENTDFTDIRTNVPGEPGIDYPVYLKIPKTNFSCIGRNQGYYADEEADCQVFHVCDADQILSFLCPVGSLFSQRLLTCDWWSKVSCSTSHQFYDLSSDFNKISLNKKHVESAANFQKNYIGHDDNESEKVYSLKKVYKDSPIIRITTLPKKQEYSSFNKSTPIRDEQLNKQPVTMEQSIIDAKREIIPPVNNLTDRISLDFGNESATPNVVDMEGKESVGLINAHLDLGTNKPSEYISSTTIANRDQLSNASELESTVIPEMVKMIKTQNIHNLAGFKLNNANEREQMITFNDDRPSTNEPDFQKYTVNYHTHYLPDTYLKYQNNIRSTVDDQRNIINNENEDFMRNSRVIKNNENAPAINSELQQHAKSIYLLWTMYQAIANAESLPEPLTNGNINNDLSKSQTNSYETNNNPYDSKKIIDESLNTQTPSTLSHLNPASRTIIQTEFIPSLSFDFTNDQDKNKYYENFQQDVLSSQKQNVDTISM